jgi:hypothetical protein
MTLACAYHKLSPPWEGPYVVVKVLKPGTYKLANEDGEELTNAWNIQQLRHFYPFVNCVRNTRVKGQLGFPQKTKSPSGATMGKWSHFFAKIREHANYIST